MTNSRIIGAMNYIGDDLIERAMMNVDVKAPSGIWMRRIAIAACLCLIVGGAGYAGIQYWNGSQPADNYGYRITMKLEYWHFDSTSFAKLKIDEIVDENLYESAPPICHRVILLKCTVLEDYYDTLESGTQIVLPIRVPTDQDKGDFLAKYREKVSTEGVVEWDELTDTDWKGEGVYVDVQAVMDFFAEYDTIFAYFRGPYFDAPLRPKLREYYSDVTGKTTERDYTKPIDMNSDEIFLTLGGKVDFRSIDSFLEKWNVFHRYNNACDFYEYVWDGMDVDTFTENIKRLKEEILEQGDFDAGLPRSCIQYE